MQLYRITLTTDIYATEWEDIKDKLVMAYQDKDGGLTTNLPGTFESIKKIEITKDKTNTNVDKT
tara:strand:+ start:824 stop:1015 length:192 start_codon:yes stop_codon:yes gene_type:complete